MYKRLYALYQDHNIFSILRRLYTVTIILHQHINSRVSLPNLFIHIPNFIPTSPKFQNLQDLYSVLKMHFPTSTIISAMVMGLRLTAAAPLLGDQFQEVAGGVGSLTPVAAAAIAGAAGPINNCVTLQGST